MLRNVSRLLYTLLGAGCKVLLFFLASGCEVIVGCYRSFVVQALLTILENACFDVTGKVYYASGAAVGTAEGLWLVARHVPLPLPPGTFLAISATASLQTSTIKLLQ